MTRLNRDPEWRRLHQGWGCKLPNNGNLRLCLLIEAIQQMTVRAPPSPRSVGVLRMSGGAFIYLFSPAGAALSLCGSGLWPATDTCVAMRRRARRARRTRVINMGSHAPPSAPAIVSCSRPWEETCFMSAATFAAFSVAGNHVGHLNRCSCLPELLELFLLLLLWDFVCVFVFCQTALDGSEQWRRFISPAELTAPFAAFLLQLLFKGSDHRGGGTGHSGGLTGALEQMRLQVVSFGFCSLLNPSSWFQWCTDGCANAAVWLSDILMCFICLFLQDIYNIWSNWTF